MNISWLGTVWAAIKGIFSFGTTAKISIVDYLFDAAYDYYSNIEVIMANIAKAYSGLVKLCDKLDYYSEYIPAPWKPYYETISDSFCALRDTLADSKVERREVETIVLKVRNAIAAWRK